MEFGIGMLHNTHDISPRQARTRIVSPLGMRATQDVSKKLATICFLRLGRGPDSARKRCSELEDPLLVSREGFDRSELPLAETKAWNNVKVNPPARPGSTFSTSHPNRTPGAAARSRPTLEPRCCGSLVCPCPANDPTPRLNKTEAWFSAPSAPVTAGHPKPRLKLTLCDPHLERVPADEMTTVSLIRFCFSNQRRLGTVGHPILVFRRAFSP